jgi:nucleoside 2-deoxyribosyltransferase
MKKIYIAGKVTGLPIEEVSDKFKTAQQALEEKGFTAVNPLMVVNDPQAKWNQAMKKCIGELVSCDAV